MKKVRHRGLLTVIYIACPFWHESPEVRAGRRQKAIAYGDGLFRKGLHFYSPLLNSERYKEKKAKEKYWLEHGLKMVDVSTEMHVLCLPGWEDSSGIKGEVAKAQKNNIEIVYIKNVSSVSFHGSRTLLMKHVEPVFNLALKELQIKTVVTHGEPTGACSHVRSLCKKAGVALKLHHLDKEKGQGMYHWRSKAVLEDSETAIFLHDGVSQGTANELELAKKLKLPFRCFVLDGESLVERNVVEKKLDWTDDGPDLNLDLEFEI